MTPPGLTCARCEQALYPTTVRATDDGWQHATRCPRTCTIDGCHNPHEAHGYCSPHYQRMKRHGDPLGEGTLRPSSIEVEDVEWMAQTGESLTGACRRLGRSAGTLQKAMARAGRSDLYRVLANREGDWNTPGRMNQKRVA